MATTNHSEPAPQQPKLKFAGKVGAALFAFWGVLHLWVGGEGLRLYFASPAQDQWRMFIGGVNAPISAFQFPVDPVTAHVHANLILNFCLDVAGYGLLGILVSVMLFKRASWTAYFMALILIGLCDLSFTFLQVTSGTIALNLPTIAGPVLWFLAVIITPFGMPRLKSIRDVI